MRITRRQTLVGVPLVALFTWSQPQVVQASPIALAKSLVLSSEGSGQAAFYSRDFGIEYVLSYPLFVTVDSDVAASKPTDVSVQFDNRLLDVRSTVLRSGPSGAFVVDSIAPSVIGSGRSEVKFQVFGSGPARSFVMPLYSRDLYPVENIGEGTPIEVMASTPGAPSSEIARMTMAPQVSHSAAVPWGVELRAGWASRDVAVAGPGDQYRLPTLVQCTSVGPNPTPDSLQVEIASDARLVGGCSIETVSVNGALSPTVLGRQTTQLSGDRVMNRFSFGSLEAGDVLAITLRYAPIAGAASVKNVAFATASVIIPQGVSFRRVTGLATAIDRTASGVPNGEDSAVGTI